jgi:hypothetical protein
MATAAPDPPRATTAGWSSSETVRALAPLMRLIVKIWSVESVQKVALATDGHHADLWIVVSEEVDEDEERIALAERDYLREVGPIPFDLHVAPLTRVDESVLPPAETILER